MQEYDEVWLAWRTDKKKREINPYVRNTLASIHQVHLRMKWRLRKTAIKADYSTQTIKLWLCMHSV